MQPSDWIQIIAASLVSVALVLNVLQLYQVARQSAVLLRSLERGAHGSLVNKNLETKTTHFLFDQELLAWHLSGRGYNSTSFEENKRRLYVLVELESHESNFLSHASGLLAGELWAAWKTVMAHGFATDEYREMWPVARKFYAASFGIFADNEIMPMAEKVRKGPGFMQQAVV